MEQREEQRGDEDRRQFAEAAQASDELFTEQPFLHDRREQHRGNDVDDPIRAAGHVEDAVARLAARQQGGQHDADDVAGVGDRQRDQQVHEEP